MLALAGVKKGETVVDLGSGSGSIVVEAAKMGALGVGVEIDPDLLRLATERAKNESVLSSVEFVRGDYESVNLGSADVVTLYLTTKGNAKVLPKLRRELRPGARVVCHDFRIGKVPPVAVRRYAYTEFDTRTLLLYSF